MKPPELEVCYKCGKPKPIYLVLRNDETGEKRPLCKEDADEWAKSDEDWPPKNTNTSNTN